MASHIGGLGSFLLSQLIGNHSRKSICLEPTVVYLDRGAIDESAFIHLGVSEDPLSSETLSMSKPRLPKTNVATRPLFTRRY